MKESTKKAAEELIEIVLQQCSGYTSGPGFEAAEKTRTLKKELLQDGTVATYNRIQTLFSDPPHLNGTHCP